MNEDRKDEEVVIVRCEKKKDEFGVEKYHCTYEGGEFEIDVSDRRVEEFAIPKSLLDKHDVKEIVRLMLEPADEGD